MVDAQTRIGIDLDHPWLHIFVNQHVKTEHFKWLAPQLKFVSEANNLVLKQRAEDLHYFATSILDCTFQVVSTRSLVLLTNRIPKRCQGALRAMICPQNLVFARVLVIGACLVDGVVCYMHVLLLHVLCVGSLVGCLKKVT